jgi:transcriptional regulator with XRE-family HTH domain
MVFDSVETWRLYAAEASVKQRMWSNSGSARRIADEVMNSAWWRMLPYQPRVRIESGGHSEGNMVASHVSPEGGELLPDSWLFSLHPDRATERTVLHELAHTIAPRVGRSDDGATSYLTYHGVWYIGAYVEMLHEFSQHEDPRPLLDALAHFQVEVPEPGAWRVALATSLEIERDVLARREPEPGRTPLALGSVLRLGRKERGWTQADLARRLSSTVACIQRIENSIGAPSSPRDSDVALRAGVLLNTDPIQMAEQFDFRWSYDHELEQLRQLNPEWVVRVEELNNLKAQRGNWWDRPTGRTGRRRS